MAQDAEKTYTIAPKYKAGEMSKSKFDMNMNMKMKPEKQGLPIPPNMLMKMGATLVQKVKSVKPDGGAIYTSEMRNGAVEVMGMQQEMPRGAPATIEVDGKGKVVKLDFPKPAGGGGGMMGGMGGMMNFDRMSSLGVFYPDKPVKVGEKWEQSVSGVLGDGAVKVVSELLALEMINNTETYKIKQVVDFPLDMKMGADQKPTTDAAKAVMLMTGKMSMVTVLNIDVANARVVKSEGKLLSNMEMKMQGAAAEDSPFGSSLAMDMDADLKLTLESVGSASADAQPIKKPSTTTKTGTKKPAGSKSNTGKRKN
jgi:hypothetical protein